LWNALALAISSADGCLHVAKSFFSSPRVMYEYGVIPAALT
jgi:hypothetical protein